jgi:hypothetical protein
MGRHIALTHCLIGPAPLSAAKNIHRACLPALEPCFTDSVASAVETAKKSLRVGGACCRSKALSG